MILSIDLGGTNTRLAWADNFATPGFAREPIRRRNAGSYNEDLAFILNAAKTLSQGWQITAIGLGIAGRVNQARNEVTLSHNLPHMANRHLAQTLADKLGCPVFMDDDGVAAGLGEGYYGHTPAVFHALIWGTGIGGVKVIRAADGVVTVERCDSRTFYDEWEMACGGAAIARRLGKPGEKLTTAEWQRIADVFITYLKRYIAATQPPALVFGGGLAVRHAAFLCAQSSRLGVPLCISEFGGDGGLVGGLALVRRGLISCSPLLRSAVQ